MPGCIAALQLTCEGLQAKRSHEIPAFLKYPACCRHVRHLLDVFAVLIAAAGLLLGSLAYVLAGLCRLAAHHVWRNGGGNQNKKRQ